MRSSFIACCIGAAYLLGACTTQAQQQISSIHDQEANDGSAIAYWGLVAYTTEAIEVKTNVGFYPYENVDIYTEQVKLDSQIQAGIDFQGVPVADAYLAQIQEEAGRDFRSNPTIDLTMTCGTSSDVGVSLW